MFPMTLNSHTNNTTHFNSLMRAKMQHDKYQY